jgi:hypothetical protein
MDNLLPCVCHELRAFICYARAPYNLNGYIVPSAKARACAILAEFNKAQTDLIGKAVILTDGKAGTVDGLWLDEFHGLRISIGGHDGKCLNNKIRTDELTMLFSKAIQGVVIPVFRRRPPAPSRSAARCASRGSPGAPTGSGRQTSTAARAADASARGPVCGAPAAGFSRFHVIGRFGWLSFLFQEGIRQ